MAGKKEDEDTEALVKKGVREGRAEAKAEAEQQQTEQRMTNLQKSYNRLKSAYNKANTETNVPQVLVGVVATGAGAMLAFKLQSWIKSATKEWVETEGENVGESTTMRLIAIHGTMPLFGIILMAIGYWQRQRGVLGSGLIGSGFGMLIGGLMGSLLVDDEAEADAED